MCGKREGHHTLEQLESRRLLSTSINLPGGSRVHEGISIHSLTDAGNGSYYFGAGRSVFKFNAADGSSTLLKTFFGVGEYLNNETDGTGFTTQIAPKNFRAFKSKVFFTAEDSSHGREVWVSDGTPAGTTLLKDISSGAGSSMPTGANVITTDDPMGFVFNDKLYFTAASDGTNYKLYVTDGTSAGTKLSTTFSPAGGVGDPHVIGGKLFFLSDTQTGRALYRSDGTNAGTVKITDVATGPGASVVQAVDKLFLLQGEEVHFMAHFTVRCVSADGSMQTVFDGTGEEGTGAMPEGVALGNRLFFTGATGPRGVEMWVSDGTPGGTAMIKDIVRGPRSSAPSYLRASDNLVYFETQTADTISLWRTDGTAAGTINLHNASTITNLLSLGKKLFFTASGNFVTDGSVAGTIASAVVQTGAVVPIDSRSMFMASGLSLVKYRDGKQTGSFDVARPSATLSAQTVITAGQKTASFDVTFTSKLGIGLGPLDGKYLSQFNGYQQGAVVVVTGPKNYYAEAFFVKADTPAADPAGAGGAIRTATYAIRAPGGTWDAGDAGTYTVNYGFPPPPRPGTGVVINPLMVNVEDLKGNKAPSGVLGTFQVSAPAVSTISLTGVVFDDFDHDGVRDASESGKSGFKIYIDADNDGKLDTGEVTATTNAQGVYLFTGRPTGAYTLRLADAMGKINTTGPLTVPARPGTTAYANFGVG